MAGAAIRIAILAQADRARRELGGLADRARETGSSISDSLGLPLGIGIGGALVSGIQGMIGQADIKAKLQAQLGTGAAAAGEMGKLAGKLYAGNFGESLAGVGDALVSVRRNIGNLGKGAGNDLEGMTKKAITLASTFDQDLGGITAAVGQIMKTGLAKNAAEAFDVITKGFQSGADKAGDLLDTFNEYGTQFRKLGLNAATATGILSQGLKNGARDADLVADSLKEFSLRAVDGSKTTAQGFKDLGLSGKTMSENISAGGPKALSSLNLTLARLRAVKDPVDKARIATALFGTQAEDLGAALFALNPATAVAALGKVGGAAQTVVDVMGDTPTAKIETFKRSLTTGFTEIAGQLAAFAMANQTWLLPIAETLGGIALAVAAVSAAQKVWTVVMIGVRAVTAAWTAAQWLLNAALWANPITIVAGVVIVLAAAFVVAYLRCTTFRNMVNGVASALWTALRAVGSFVSGAVVWLAALPGRIGGIFGNVGSILYRAGASIMGGLMNGLRAGWQRVTSFLSSVTSWIPDWKGPPSRDRTLLAASGRLIMAGFQTGLESQYPAVKASLGGLTDSLSAAPLDITAGRITTAAGAGTAGGPPITLEIASGGSRMDDLLVELMRGAVRTRGGNVQVVLGQ